MISTYRLESEKLDNSLINSIKELYRGREIQIIISEIPKSIENGTLLKRLENVRNGNNLITFTEEEFNDFVDNSVQQ